MNLQFADLNKDGYKDIITATYAGMPWVVYGTKNGWKPPEYLVDIQGREIVLSEYTGEQGWATEADRSPKGLKNPKGHCIAATAYDWDNDGDLDLLLSDKNQSHLYLQKNLGSATNPRFEGVNYLLKTGDSELIIPGGVTAVRPFDWDNDGDHDFLMGSFGGGLYLVENIGKTGAVKLAAPVQLLDGELNLDGKICSSVNWYVDPVDYDNDGKTDLLVGMHVNKPVERKPLTKKQEAELEALKKRLDTLNKMTESRWSEVVGEKSGKEMEAAVEKFFNANKETDEQIDKVNERIAELEPPATESLPSVWLFRGK